MWLSCKLALPRLFILVNRSNICQIVFLLMNVCGEQRTSCSVTRVVINIFSCTLLYIKYSDLDVSHFVIIIGSMYGQCLSGMGFIRNTDASI